MALRRPCPAVHHDRHRQRHFRRCSAAIRINLAAITAAICAGPEAHPDPGKRWPAPVSAGVVYLLLAPGASLAAAFIAASPPMLIQAVAGLALLSSLAAALTGRLAQEETRLPAIVTFVTTASGHHDRRRRRAVLGAGRRHRPDGGAAIRRQTPIEATGK